MHKLLTIFTIFLFLNNGVGQSTNKRLSKAVNIKSTVNGNQQQKSLQTEPLLIKKCGDFSVTGTGENGEWNKTGWNSLTKLDSGGRNYSSRFKMMYSNQGIYILFSGEDDKITTKDYKDFEAIYNGDVFEVFFHPQNKIPVYFEYEINQLSKELILMLTKSQKQIYSWSPTNYPIEDDKPIKRKVNVLGGNAELGSSIKSWSAELFFPYSVLGLLPGVPPKTGAVWNANFCRLDYDSGNMTKYSWSPNIKTSFHEIEKFKSIKFE